MDLLSLLLLFLLTLGASSLFFAFQGPVRKAIHLLLAFSGAYLLGITLLKLMPQVYSSPAQPLIPVLILVGFVIQIMLETFSKGVEHGHLTHTSGKLFPLSVTAGLGIHAFIEGMPLAQVFSPQENITTALYIGILFHKIPAAFVLFAMMMQSKTSHKQAFAVLLIFALMTPLGALLSQWYFTAIMTAESEVLKGILSLVAGSFLYISTTILYEASTDHQYTPKKLLLIVLGLGLSLFMALH